MQFNSSHLRMFLSVLALLISFSLPTLASEPIDPVQFAQRANTWKLRIEQIDASVRAPNIDDVGLAQQRRELERLSATIDEELKLQQPVISDLRESLSRPRGGAAPRCAGRAERYRQRAEVSLRSNLAARGNDKGHRTPARPNDPNHPIYL